MSIAESTVRLLKYGISKARNVRNSELVPAPAIINRGDMAKLAAELRACGYNLTNWTRGGIEYWAVSDLNAEELGRFSSLVRTVH